MSIKAMAYGGNSSGTDSATYRMERNTPYMRAGQLVPNIPKFKALATFTPSPKNIQKALRVTMTYTRVNFPIPNVPNATSGGS